MKLAIYGSRRQKPYLASIEAFLNALKEAGDEAVMHTKLYHYLLHFMPAAMAAVKRVTDTTDFEADFAVSIGGDGSLLRTAAWVADKEIPIVGVNTGHLGYLTSLHVDRLPELPEILRQGNHTIENRSLIAVECPEAVGWPYALNEVAITKGDGASIIDIDSLIDGRPLTDYRADGLLISTPTGSTAYNLSVGGPIIEPQTPVWVISPIAAHALTMRPLVVSDSSQLKLCPEARAEHFRLSVDGRSVSLPIGTEVSLRRAPFEVAVLHMPGQTFSETLRNKLHWGVD